MDTIALNWADLKVFINSRSASLQFVEFDQFYQLWAINAPMVVTTLLQKDGNPDTTDFETNYKDTANQTIAQKLAPFALGTVQFMGDSSDLAQIPPGAQAFNMDYFISPKVFPNGVYLTGGELITQNSTMGDFVSAQVIDVQGVLGAGPNFVVTTYINRFYVQVPLTTQATITMEIDTNYAALIPAGLYLRLNYTSTGALTTTAAVNYMLHMPVVIAAAPPAK